MSTPYESFLSRSTKNDNAVGHLAEAVDLAETARWQVDHQNYDRGTAWAALATMHAALAGAMAALDRVAESQPPA